MQGAGGGGGCRRSEGPRARTAGYRAGECTHGQGCSVTEAGRTGTAGVWTSSVAGALSSRADRSRCRHTAVFAGVNARIPEPESQGRPEPRERDRNATVQWPARPE